MLSKQFKDSNLLRKKSTDPTNGANSVRRMLVTIVVGGRKQNFLVLVGGDVLLDGAHFENVPREGITIATWIRLDTNKGIQSIFDTVGSHSRHRDGQYHFEIDNGKVRWFHRNENHDTIFSLLTRPVVREGIWTQLTATYNAQKQRARVSIEIYRPGVPHGGGWIW